MSKKTTKNKAPWYQSLMGLKRTVDQAVEEAEKTSDSEEEETEDEDDEEENKTRTGDSAFQSEMRKFMKTMDKRIAAIEKKTKDSEKEETEDEDEEESETNDSGDLTEAEEAEQLSGNGVQSYTGDSLKEVVSRAEILSPGYRMPTFDSAKNGKAVLNVKRQVLKASYATQDGQKAITPFVGADPDFDKLPTHTIDAAFTGASELIKMQNNSRGVRSGIKTNDFGRAAPTPAEINARNRDFWNKQGK